MLVDAHGGERIETVTVTGEIIVNGELAHVALMAELAEHLEAAVHNTVTAFVAKRSLRMAVERFEA